MVPVQELPPCREGPPFWVDPSHAEIVLCGGFAGCTACFAVSSCGGGRLRVPCRLTGPAGSVGPVRRLCKGRPPWKRLGAAWPSFELEPKPRLWRPH